MSLRNHWYIACESRALKSKPRTVAIFGQAIVLWRDEARKAHALLDRCAHRNAPLSNGRVRVNGLQCGYHGWCYNGAGFCTHVPALAKARTLPEKARVQAFPVMEQDSYVWLWPGDAQPSGAPFAFPHHGEGESTTFHLRTRFGS